MGVLNGSKGYGDNGGLFSTHTAVLSKSCAVVFIQKIVTLFFQSISQKHHAHIKEAEPVDTSANKRGTSCIFKRSSSETFRN